ncbi:MAG: 3-deoxy-7-phosphoheptulonate synthase [candidate division Zixibacteria bacterium]|nr:3-deoxy-7-phosphoheptulonate synthase [candidate division Zixibacteria bacterium]
MLVVMEGTATPDMVNRVCAEIQKMGLVPHPIPGPHQTAIGITGSKSRVDSDHLLALAGVRDIIQITQPYKLASREFHPENTVVDVNGVKLGGESFVVIGGPCSVESREQTMEIASQMADAGVRLFRGGAFKPRTSPYSFQGLGKPGLEILAEVRSRFGLRIVTEAIDTEMVDLVAEYADMIQIGARNMQNYSLLKRVGRINKPVLLKRGMSATLEELLMAAEYIMVEGNSRVALCERGIRTLAEHTRNTLDLAAIPAVKRMSHLPILADPSHGTGRRDKVLPMARAAFAAGADGLMVEVHHSPESALSDGQQAITPLEFELLMQQLRKLALAMDRTIG